jgi:hypothetical protein
MISGKRLYGITPDVEAKPGFEEASSAEVGN